MNIRPDELRRLLDLAQSMTADDLVAEDQALVDRLESMLTQPTRDWSENMIDATGLKEAGKVLKEALYESGESPYTPAYFEFVATSAIGAYLTKRSGSSEFVVIDRNHLASVIDECYASLDLAKTKDPGISAILIELIAALNDQQ